MFDFPSSPADGQTYGGYVYRTNPGAWVQAGGPANIGSPFKRTAFGTSSSTFQYDTTTVYADVEVIGGGGGGGSSAAGAAAGLATAAAGGGAGGYAKKLIQITDAIRAATKTIAVGAGGTNASSGGTSSYADGTNTVQATGGTPGGAGVFNATLVTRAGSQGGTGSGGDVNMTGMYGETGISFGSTQCGAGAGAARAGAGAAGPGPLGGSGGIGGQFSATGTAIGSNGGNATGFGGGGGGGAAANAVGTVPTGGLGYQGLVVITEYR